MQLQHSFDFSDLQTNERINSEFISVYMETIKFHIAFLEFLSAYIMSSQDLNLFRI